MSAVRCSFGPVSDEQLAALVRQMLQSSSLLTQLLAENDAAVLIEKTTKSVIQRLAQDMGVEPDDLSSKSMLVAHEVRARGAHGSSKRML